jgi:hypothetical protein
MKSLIYYLFFTSRFSAYYSETSMIHSTTYDLIDHVKLG